MTETPTKTLPERMREAVPLFLEVAARINEGCDVPEFECSLLSAFDLRKFADEWEREDAAAAAINNEVEELARLMYRQQYGELDFDDDINALQTAYRDRARAIIDAGWRKQDPT